MTRARGKQPIHFLELTTTIYTSVNFSGLTTLINRDTILLLYSVDKRSMQL